MTDITVTRNDEKSQYEIRRDGELAGVAVYERGPGEVRFTRTEVDPALRGQGLAERLAQEALADAASAGDTIVPVCPYIVRYLEKHDVPGAKVRRPDDTDAPQG